jgi:hypothetical protein
MVGKKGGATDKKDELAVSGNEENLKVDEMIENETMKNEIKEENDELNINKEEPVEVGI